MAELSEFLEQQARDWRQARDELAAGQKRSHWIWWIVPQLAVLGRSPRARHYGLADLGEATAYLAHPVLRQRLEEVATLMLAQAPTTPEAVLGPVDALKLRSSMTLFEAVPGAPPVFAEVLDRLYAGDRCALTQEVIAEEQ